eukprot:473698-Rhodomonas_salina.1
MSGTCYARPMGCPVPNTHALWDVRYLLRTSYGMPGTCLQTCYAMPGTRHSRGRGCPEAVSAHARATACP